MENRAIIITYVGDETPDVLIERLCQSMRAFVHAGSIHVSKLDTEDIRDALVLAKTISPKDECIIIGSKMNNDADKMEATENALVYIGTMCANILKDKKLSSSQKYILLAHEIIDLIRNGDERMKNAVKIISSSRTTTVKASILKEYGLTKDLINSISNVGTFMD